MIRLIVPLMCRSHACASWSNPIMPSRVSSRRCGGMAMYSSPTGPSLEATLINLPRSLLARSFLLIVVLIVLSLAASVAIFRHVQQEPHAKQMAQLVVSVVNLTPVSYTPLRAHE